MQKAHLYEAILLINRGIDDAVRGLERLKRAKESGLKGTYLDEKLTLFEMHRALLNSYFCNNVEGIEVQDEAHFAKRHREHEKRMLDEVQVYQDLRSVEERRRLEGRPPKVRFMTEEEQRAWQHQYPNPSSGTEATRSE
jgi:Mg-chelatase subunit ChlI